MRITVGLLQFLLPPSALPPLSLPPPPNKSPGPSLRQSPGSDVGSTPFSASPSRSSSTLARALRVQQPPAFPTEPRKRLQGPSRSSAPPPAPGSSLASPRGPTLRPRLLRGSGRPISGGSPGDPILIPTASLPPPAARAEAAPPLPPPGELGIEEIGRRGGALRDPPVRSPLHPKGRRWSFLLTFSRKNKLKEAITGYRGKVTDYLGEAQRRDPPVSRHGDSQGPAPAASPAAVANSAELSLDSG